MTSVSSVSSSNPAPITGADGKTQFSAGADRTAMDTDTFLKLLVAQLQYQDPSNPTDTTQFMSQTAQFTSVEKMVQLNDMTQKVLNASLTQTATSLVGKTVQYTDAAGKTQSGLVTGCTLQSATPNLTVNGVQVELTDVTNVVAATSPA